MVVNRAFMRTARQCRKYARFHRSLRDRWRLRWRIYFNKRPVPGMMRA